MPGPVDVLVLSDSEDDEKSPRTQRTDLQQSGANRLKRALEHQRSADTKLEKASTSSLIGSHKPAKLAKTTDLSANAQATSTGSSFGQMQVQVAAFRWITLTSHPTVLYGRNFAPSELRAPVKLAAFDLDGTLIRTKTGNTFPRNEYDWQLWSDRVKPKLQHLHDEGYSIAIISNQNYKGKHRDWFRAKVIDISARLEVPLRAVAALEKDHFRKPNIGMWDLVKDKMLYETGVEVDVKNSFFVGDAAGRVGDHSRADIDMACNVGLTFHTPEQFFNK
ncbi:hypothetical protein ACM66B_002683 [Microbotryomycetes sp. NB124-2]